MKKMYFLCLIILFCPFFLYTQDFSKSKYQEYSLNEAFESCQNNNEEVQYYKSMAHFRTFCIDTIEAVFYKDGSQFSSFICYFSFPEIEPFQAVIIYYRFVRGPYGNFYNLLDYIELVNNYLIVGTRYMVMENLQLRNRENLSGDIIKTIKKDEWVTVLEEGNEETIEGLTSIWVRVRLSDNTEGWCFGAYLGLDFL